MISVYVNWSEEQKDEFIGNKWADAAVGQNAKTKFHNDMKPMNEWEDWDKFEWWGEFMNHEFRQEWTYEDLVNSLKKDLSENKSLDDLLLKYTIDYDNVLP